MTAIFQAAETDNLEELKKLLDEGTDIYTANFDVHFSIMEKLFYTWPQNATLLTLLTS